MSWSVQHLQCSFNSDLVTLVADFQPSDSEIISTPSLLQLQLKSIIILIIMEICKAPTLRLKALNKPSITHIMYIEMEMLSVIKMKIKLTL